MGRLSRAEVGEPHEGTLPILSLCIPTYNRPEWLGRAIRSIVAQGVTAGIEVLVSDNSQGTESRDVVTECLGDWPGAWSYHQNVPTVPMIENFNRLIARATGRYVLMLSDDDYLLPGGLALALETLGSTDRAACLFGVHIVDAEERVRKRPGFGRARYFPPQAAVRQLLSNSSFVRFPGIAVKTSVLREFGSFDPETLNMCDLDMWFKVFSKYGVRCVPGFVSAYTTHVEAHTMTMFRTEILDLLIDFFARVERSGTVPPERLDRYRSLFFHQYILAGTYRNLRWHGRQAARDAFSLFGHEAMRALKVPMKWLPLRMAFAIFLGQPRRAIGALPGVGD